MNQPLNPRTLRQQTLAFRGTCGESRLAGGKGFLPAFCDPASGRVELARLANGQPAAMHLITYLPADWTASRDGAGRVLTLRPGIVAGFVRDDRFFTREEAAAETV